MIDCQLSPVQFIRQHQVASFVGLYVLFVNFMTEYERIVGESKTQSKRPLTLCVGVGVAGFLAFSEAFNSGTPQI